MSQRVWLREQAQTIISVALLLLLLVIAEMVIGWARLLAPWQALSSSGVFTALLLMGVSYATRAGRLYHYFLPQTRGGFVTACKLMLQHNLANNLLPMRSGELTFPWLMQRYFSVPLERSLPGLFWFRLLDLYVLLGYGAIATAIWSDRPLLLLALIPYPIIPFIAARALQRLGTFGERSTRLSKLVEKLKAGLPNSHRGVFWSLGWSGLTWGIKLAVFAWVLQQFVAIDYSVAWIAASVGDLTSVLPIHGVAGAGTFEAGISAVLLPAGVAFDVALAAAINLHLFLLGASLLGGMVAWGMPVKKMEE